ncbi:hypothetical protein TWF694_001339 [Orbilia ellipsospora]|uniref:RNase III domain-containing protein n=1 Tax=Orbilia ellipsospora TaxID=2528407 RepID=A0AAV9XS39_9PEZI
MVNQDKIESTLGYKFTSSALLTEALEAAGRAYTHDDTEGGMDGNKRLAMVGDALLTLIHFDMWYPSGQSRETAENSRQKYTSNVNLEKCAEEFGIKSEILLSAGDSARRTVAKVTSASTVEALLGAVWLDSSKNFDKVKDVAFNLGIAKNYVILE